MKKLLLTAILSSSLIMETTFADDRYILKDDNKNTINSNSKDNNQKDINKDNNNTQSIQNISKNKDDNAININVRNGRFITILNLLRNEFGVEYYIEDPYSSLDYSSLYKTIDIKELQQQSNQFNQGNQKKTQEKPQIDENLNVQSGQVLLGVTGQGGQQSNQQAQSSSSSSFCGQPIIFEPITISTTIKRENLKSFISNLCDIANVDCSYNENENVLRIKRYKEYAINVSNLFSITLNEPVEVVASSSSSSSSSQGAGQSGAASGGVSSIKYSTAYNEFINNLVGYKSCEGKVVSSGDTLYIMDRPKYAQAMVNVLKKELEKKPLDLKISIYRFVYNTDTTIGVNFSLTGLLKNFLSNNIRYGLNVNTAGLVTSPAGSFVVSGINGQQRVLFNFLEKYGKLYLVNEWNASLKPSVPVILRDTENIPYVVPQLTTSTSGTSVSYEPRFVSVGLKLTLSLSGVKREDEEKQKYQGNIIAELSELIAMENFTVGTDSNGKPISTQIPDVKGTKVYIPFEITPNDMVILTGFRVSSKNYTAQGVPYLSRIPVINKLFGESEDLIRRSEIIIVVSPIYDNDRNVMDSIIKEVEGKTEIREK